MYWDNEYRRNKRVWGEGPSELAITAVRYLQKCNLKNERLGILILAVVAVAMHSTF